MHGDHELELTYPAHQNHGLFADNYLNVRLPRNPAWEALDDEARPVFEAMRALFATFAAEGANERQTEDDLICPILDLLGHTYEVQASLRAQQSTKTPDYIFFNSADAKPLRGMVLTENMLRDTALAVGDAKKWNRPLDVALPEKGPDKFSNQIPAVQIAFYVQHSGLSWGLLTNGRLWRLVHRDSAHKLDVFYEVDLAEIVNSGDVRRFRYFYAFFRRAAFDPGPLGLEEMLRESTEYAHGIGASLKGQVFEALRHIAQGFLDYLPNELQPDDATLQEVYDNALIVLYRLLFVLYAEARELLPVRENRDYRESFSLKAIKGMAAENISRKLHLLPGSTLLWPRLRQLFQIIDNGSKPLKVATFNGGLFDPSRHPFLERCVVGDAHLQQAIDKLARVDKEFVDYRDLSVRHMGTIYEGLLEFRLYPLVAPSREWSVDLVNDRGERKTTGSFYTPEQLVKFIVERSVGPVLWHAVEGKQTDQEIVTAVLGINVLDPAMGSGHFLVEATEYIARFLADYGIVPEGKTSEEADLAYWKRRVVQSCIYGVDMNPLAVELAKLSLWLITVAKDRPLSFLDHHLRPGNSLVGTRLSHLRQNGNGRKKNGARAAIRASQASPEQSTLFSDAEFAGKMSVAVSKMWRIEESEALDVAQVKEQEALYADLRQQLVGKFGKLADLFTAQEFGGAVPDDLMIPLVDLVLKPAQDPLPALRDILRNVEEVAARERFFHWELEFPEVYFNHHGLPLYEAGGFDAVIGNPPWERIKLAENEFFAAREPSIALATRAADRKRIIKSLPETNPQLWDAYRQACTRTEQMSAYVHKGDHYPLMGKGDTNYYAIFAEKALQMIRQEGRIGLLVPSGIATDDTTKDYFQYIVSRKMLNGLFDFENRKAIFPEIHRSFKFTIILISGEGAQQEQTQCGFFLHGVEDMQDPQRIFALTAEDFRLFNPNTLTCPIFRRRRDMELTRKIYRHAAVLVNKGMGEEGNPWGVSFLRMFDMTNDSNLFHTAAELESAGCWLGDGNIYTKGAERFLPLYEGKMVQMYDHRAATITINPKNVHRPAQEEPVSVKEHQDSHFSPMPQYWVGYEQVDHRFNGHKVVWQLGFKEITAPTNFRTFISAVLPPVAFGNKIPLLVFHDDSSQNVRCSLVANFNCFAFDYATRQKIGGQTLNYFIVEQLPVLHPNCYTASFQGVLLSDFIMERVLKLCYTAWDLKSFAEDMGYNGPPFPWDEEERLHLRCQLDSLYFHLYGLQRDEAGDILDTFPIVKRQDEASYGHYRTKDLILSYYNAYAAGNMDAYVKG